MPRPRLHSAPPRGRRRDRTAGRDWPAAIGLALALTLAPGTAALAAERPRGTGAATELVPLSEDRGGPRFLLLSVPAGPMPDHGFPMVLLIPDADGPGPRTDSYALRLLENHFAVAEPYLNRGALGSFLPETLSVLALDPRLDTARLAAIGLGAGARRALAEWAAGAPVVALALLYPGCDEPMAETARRATPSSPDTAVLLLHGTADPANPPAACAALALALAPRSHPRHDVLEGASYAWDATQLVPAGASLRALHPASPEGPRVLARPDAWTTMLAMDRIIAFLIARPR